MTNKKISIIVFGVIIVLAILALAGYLIYTNLIASEFVYVNLSYQNEKLTLTTDPVGLLTSAKIAKSTDIHLSLKNDSEGACGVNLKFQTLNKNFVVKSNEEYGDLLPRGEKITITFCGQEQEIDLGRF